MENLCNTCKWYDKQYDDFRGRFDDNIYEKDQRDNHSCVMYDDYIPNKIWYENGDCPYYRKKDGD